MKKIYGNERIIPYRPQLKQFFGSTNAAVLYAQLEYWFDKKDGQSFYKFNAPCNNENYKKGNSLVEELGFSHDELESALKRICRSFKSKKDFDACEDKFDNMPMCSYYDRITYTKHYFRNHEVCDYINSRDMEDLPVFEDGRSASLESGYSVFGNRDITCSIYILYNRLQQKIMEDTAYCDSITKSDAVACTSPLAVTVSHNKTESEVPSQTLRETPSTRGRGARGKTEASTDGKAFALWFKGKTPMRAITEAVLSNWAETYDKLVSIGYTKSEVAKMCEWALSDPFWSKNFLSASKLMSKNKEGVFYHEFFSLQLKTTQQPQVKSIYNEKKYNPTGSHLDK